MTKIIVTKRSDDYYAHFEGRNECWGCGSSPREAIGSLVQTHAEHIDVAIEYPVKDKCDKDVIFATADDIFEDLVRGFERVRRKNKRR